MGKKAGKRKTTNKTISSSGSSPGSPYVEKGSAGKIVIAVGVVAAIISAGLYWLLAPGMSVIGADPTDQERVVLGRTVYGDQCASCHGADLQGQDNWRARNADGTLPAPPHDRTGHTWHHPDRFLFDYTRRGGAAMGIPGFKSAMPGFREILKDGEIRAVLAYIKSRWPASVLARQRQIDARGKQRGK